MNEEKNDTYNVSKPKRLLLTKDTRNRNSLLNERSNFVPQTKTVMMHTNHNVIIDSPSKERRKSDEAKKFGIVGGIKPGGSSLGRPVGGFDASRLVGRSQSDFLHRNAGNPIGSREQIRKQLNSH